jgi:hypothetical protein
MMENEQEENHEIIRHLKEYAINVVEHDDLRLCYDQIVTEGEDVFFILDEADKALNHSKRTSAALDIAKNAKSSLLMTGTIMVDSDLDKLKEAIYAFTSMETSSSSTMAENKA